METVRHLGDAIYTDGSERNSSQYDIPYTIFLSSFYVRLIDNDTTHILYAVTCVLLSHIFYLLCSHPSSIL